MATILLNQPAFIKRVEALLSALGSERFPLKYHSPQERNPSGRGWRHESSFCVYFHGAAYGIRLCQVSAGSAVQVFVARLEGNEGKGNNYHVSFSNEHVDEYGIFYVKPSLKRCQNKRLLGEPTSIGSYPAWVCGSKAEFKVGKLDRNFFPRIFSIVDTKYGSL